MNIPFSSSWQFYTVIETECKWGINRKYYIKASSYGWQKHLRTLTKYIDALME